MVSDITGYPSQILEANHLPGGGGVLLQGWGWGGGG